MDETHPASSHLTPPPGGQVPLSEGAHVCARGWGWHHAGRKNAMLSGVDLDIAPSEHMLVLGPSGPGRSTFMGGLAGLLGGAEGGDAASTPTVDGVVLTEVRGHVGLPMQDPEAQVVLVRVDNDVAFGIESLGVARKKIWPRVGNPLEVVGPSIPLDHSTTGLLGGQKQRLALASILVMGPDLLPLGESITNLNPSGVAEVRATAETVVERTGATVVVVEHRVDVRAFLMDRVIVIADGAITANGPLDEALAQRGDALRERGIWLPGGDVAAKAGSALKVPPAPFESPEEGVRGTTPVTCVTDLMIGYDASIPARSGIDLMIEHGVSTYIIGANGAGESAFALTLAGPLSPLAGTVEVETVDGTDGDPHEWGSKQLLGRISMVSQEPGYQFLAAAVAEELMIGPRAVGITDEEIAPLIDEHLKVLDLTRPARANPMALSGNERHRLSVTTAPISALELLILDEPAFGQDHGTWLDLVCLLCVALERGVTLVSITHDPAFVAAMSQHVIDLGQVGMHGAASEDSTGGAGSAPVGNIRDHSPKCGVRDLLVYTDPVAYVLALLAAIIPLLTTIGPVSAVVAVILELALMLLSGVSTCSFSLKAAPLLLTVLPDALSMLFYTSLGGAVYWQFRPVAILDHLIWLALGIGLRMRMIVPPTIVLLDHIDSTDMSDGFAWILHLPAHPMLAMLAGACMASLMAADWKTLKRARCARGVSDSSRTRSFLRGSFSLLVFTLRHSDEPATTMEARGFSAEGKRIWARPSRLRTTDTVFMVVAITLPAITLAVSIRAGAFAPVGR